MNEGFDDLLLSISESIGLESTATDAAEETLLARISIGESDWDNTGFLAQAASISETSALLAYKESNARSSGSEQARGRAEALFTQAFSCYQLIAQLRERERDIPLADDPILPVGLDLPFRIAASGLLSRRTADVRMALDTLVEIGDAVAAYAPGQGEGSLDWERRLLADSFGSFILLVRKKDGWADVDAALSALNRLRDVQSQLEPATLEHAMGSGSGREVALRLVGLFHLTQAVTITGLYLRDGGTATPTVLARLDRHRDHAFEALEQVTFPHHASFLVLADLLWAGCREIVRNSIWAHVEGLGEQITNFAKHLASRGRPNPVLELWPSQQEALGSSVLDQYRRAVLVQMPTSAGKTLLAEFLIIQSRALVPSGTIAYVVPTRALVNQVTRDLRADLSPLDLSVEQAVPAFEIDPTEQAILSDAPAVIVTTAEKFSLLVRRAHVAVQNISLVVVDEAHNLADGERGARLELLLATLRRDRPGARYLLLSPFLPEPEQLIEWLGDDRGLPPISVNWRPGRRVMATVSVEGRRPNRELVLKTLDAAGGADIRGGRTATIGAVQNEDLVGSKTIKASTRLAARALRSRGNTLVLCWGPADAMKRAAEIASDCRPLPSDPFRDSVERYLRAEYGEDASLAEYLRVGVAYHHSGMSQEARLLVERLLRVGHVHTVCGTTTLAQGVNFPISNVLIETSRKGRDQRLSYADLWNIVGRAGRTLLDDTGLVGFPIADQRQADSWQEFLRGEALAVSSQLAELIDKADELQQTIGLQEVRNIPALSDMLQFLAHALRVGGAQQTAAELEDLLRSSLVYRQASSAPNRADRLVRICRRYLEDISGQPGWAALSDQTGFSTPTVSLLLARRQDAPGLTDPDTWQPDVLFGSDHDQLTERMRILGDVPELGLGYEAAGTFNSYRAGRIVADWVNGDPISVLAEKYGGSAPSADRRQADFARYLYGTLSYKASWGLGAMESSYLPADSSPSADDSYRYVPSMVYFGVKTPEAVWMRMAGVPRIAAVRAGEIWRDQVRTPPSTYQEIREWIGGLRRVDWDSVVSGLPLTGDDMQRLWTEALG